MAQSVLTNAAVASLGRLLNGILGLTVTALVSRFLGPSHFGTYTLLLSVGALLQIATDAGLYLTLAQKIAHEPDHTERYLQHVVSLRVLLWGIVFTVGALILHPHLPPGITLLAVVVVASSFLWQSLSQLIMAYFQAHGVVWKATVGDLVGRLIHLAVIGLFVIRQRDVGSALVALSAATAGTFIIHRLYLPTRRLFTRLLSLSLIHSIVKSSWPFGVLLLLNAIYFRIDTVILSYFRSPTEVGWYGVAYRMIESGLFFPAMFGGLLLPRLVAALRTNRATAIPWLQEGLHLMLLATGAIIAIIPLTAPELILFFSGTEFAPAGVLLQILSLALTLMFFGNIFGFTLVALGQHTVLLKLYAILVVVNVISNILLIPTWGAGAAAWTTVITELLATVSAGYFVHRSLPYQVPVSVISKIIISVAVTALVILLLPASIHIVVQVAVGALVYGLSLFVWQLTSARYIRLLRLAW